MSHKTQNDIAHKNKILGLSILAVVILMIGVSFAAVPLYDLFCSVTGYGGTTQTADALPENTLDRTVTINFNADTGRNMNWVFKPEQRSITVKLGERGITAFTAKNKLNRPTAGTALYNVTPLKAGKYFHKIQCFCFDEQILGPKQEVSMPVLFYVDPKMHDDPNMNEIKTITLSYTFFPADSKALEDALEAFYNENSGDVTGTN